MILCQPCTEPKFRSLLSRPCVTFFQDIDMDSARDGIVGPLAVDDSAHSSVTSETLLGAARPHVPRHLAADVYTASPLSLQSPRYDDADSAREEVAGSEEEDEDEDEDSSGASSDRRRPGGRDLFERYSITSFGQGVTGAAGDGPRNPPHAAIPIPQSDRSSNGARGISTLAPGAAGDSSGLEDADDGSEHAHPRPSAKQRKSSAMDPAKQTLLFGSSDTDLNEGGTPGLSEGGPSTMAESPLLHQARLLVNKSLRDEDTAYKERQDQLSSSVNDPYLRLSESLHSPATLAEARRVIVGGSSEEPAEGVRASTSRNCSLNRADSVKSLKDEEGGPSDLVVEEGLYDLD